MNKESINDVLVTIYSMVDFELMVTISLAIIISSLILYLFFSVVDVIASLFRRCFYSLMWMYTSNCNDKYKSSMVLSRSFSSKESVVKPDMGGKQPG